MDKASDIPYIEPTEPDWEKFVSDTRRHIKEPPKVLTLEEVSVELEYLRQQLNIIFNYIRNKQ